MCVEGYLRRVVQLTECECRRKEYKREENRSQENGILYLVWGWVWFAESSRYQYHEEPNSPGERSDNLQPAILKRSLPTFRESNELFKASWFVISSISSVCIL